MYDFAIKNEKQAGSVIAHNQVLILSDDPDCARLWALGMSQRSVPAMAVVLDENTAEVFSHRAFDLVLLDINQGVDKATSLCRRMRDAFEGPILLLTHMRDERFHVGAYQTGIDESIAKPIGLHLMIAKTEAWLRAAERFSSPSRDSLNIDNLRLDMQHQVLMTPGGRTLHLSRREAELLALLMKARGRPMTSAELVEHIWPRDDDLEPPLLHNLVYRLRQKIERDPGHPKYLETVVGDGYRLRADAPQPRNT